MDEQQPIEPPSYKLQDPVDVITTYRQKFVQKLKEVEPQVLEDLRELSPNFEALFSNKIEKDYIHLLMDLALKLIPLRGIYPDYKYSPMNQSYIWGELKKPLSWTLKYYDSIHTDYKFENDAVTNAISEDNKLNPEDIKSVIETAFQETAKDKNLILSNFSILQNGIYLWIEKYDLQKDWLVEYAYYFIYQFSHNKSISVGDLTVDKRLYMSDTMYSDFEFKTRGWQASKHGESAPTYKARIEKEFEKKLNEYLSEATHYLGLKEMKKFTKSPTYKNVEWLAYSLIKKCDAERLVEKFYSDIAAERTKDYSSSKKFENKKKHIENEIKKLKIYGLPENEMIEKLKNKNK
jgi:hypothetical protein